MGRAKRVLVAGAAVVALLVVVGGVYLATRSPGQALSIPGVPPTGPWPTAGAGQSATTGPPFVTSVRPDGRSLMDQYGKPLLVHGDSPWALMTRVDPAQVRQWFADRQRQGVNAAIVSLIGAKGNGGPADDGSTVDGLRPFVGGDVLRWQQAYWNRVDSYLRMAAQQGITVMLYPIDGWTIGTSFVPSSISQCDVYGRMLAQRYARFPNIVWMSGGDYFPATKNLASGSDADHCIDATMRGLRAGGDDHLFSMQLGYPKSVSTENPYWAGKVDWNFVYTYQPTYRAVLDAYAHRPALPAVLGEANYEGENNDQDTPGTTRLTLRRQLLWSLTSGAAGDFTGSHDWEFNPGWEHRLDTRWTAQSSTLHHWFVALPEWWRLQPDTQNRLVTGGRGTLLTSDRKLDVLQNDYVTAALTPDGKLAVVYLPSAHTITVDRSALAQDVTATWVDPATGATRAVGTASSYTTPGRNADGDQDWLLIFRSR